MFKRFLGIALIGILFIQMNVFAFQETIPTENEIIIKRLVPELFKDDSLTVSRGVCIMSLMRVLGVDRAAADYYANANYFLPVFLDIDFEDVNAGYIIVSKFGGVSVGEPKNETNPITNFCSERNVTVRECLAFMLRCLKDQKQVEWGNVMRDSVQIGLLKTEELNELSADDALLKRDFVILLSRMLNMNRYLYWPAEEMQNGRSKSMQTDTSKSVRYFDRFAEEF